MKQKIAIVQKQYDNFHISHFQKKNSVSGNYLLKYGIYFHGMHMM